MSAIDWIRLDNDEKYCVANLTITLRNNQFNIVFQDFNSNTRTKIEGRITLNKILDEQCFNGNISYIAESNHTDSYPFKITGQFTDDNFDEFIGSWIEGGILHKITISLEDIREIA
jgi:hypothetical protein